MLRLAAGLVCEGAGRRLRRTVRGEPRVVAGIPGAVPPLSEIGLDHMVRHLIQAGVAVATFLAMMVSSIAVAAAEETDAVFTPPKRYYLSLGDSIAYGFQTDKAVAGLPPQAFDTGFVDVFSDRLRTLRPGNTKVNYACPGESTRSYRSPCIWKTSGHALHDDYSGSQADAALAFLRAHRGQVSPITVALNGNDATEFVRSCPPGDLACITNSAPAAIAAYQARLKGIVAQLRSAAPDAEIILTGSYNPNVGAFAVSDPLFIAFNAAEAAVATDTRATFANPFPVFNPQGDQSAETAAICELTLICTQGDTHPSDAGYRAIAGVVWTASGYSRLS